MLPRVSVLFPNQFEQAAIALGRAFVRDPALMAILPETVVSEPVERVRRITEVFRAALSVQRREGEPVLGVLADGRVAGAAVIAGGRCHRIVGLPQKKRAAFGIRRRAGSWRSGR